VNLDFAGKAVLITEGAFGLGLHIALAFARRGAACIQLHREAAPDVSQVLQLFADAGVPLPTLAQVDAARDENLDGLLRELQARHGEIEALIQVGTPSPEELSTPASFEEYSRQDFLRAVENDAWSLVEYPRAIKRVFGAYPRYIVGVVGTSALEYSPGADFIAASESAMESLCRYVNHHLFDEDVRVNVLRYRNVALNSVATDNSAQRFTPPEYSVPPEEVADAAVALCSGLMDCMSGHVLTVDRGTGFFDNLMRLYTQREQYQL
jgi:NAD(P)-dependent dehydrogenase (short-subunit alcohol dehydrogenase family)